MNSPAGKKTIPPELPTEAAAIAAFIAALSEILSFAIAP